MAQHDDIKTPVVAVVGILSVLATVAVIVGLQALYLRFERAEYRRKVVDAGTPEASHQLAQQEAKLNRLGWINREQQTLAIPIDRAMQLVVQELRSQQQEATTESGGSTDALGSR